MTVYFFASSGATRYQDRWVSGAPWISRSGGPLPPTTVCSVAPVVLTLCTLKPGKSFASSALASALAGALASAASAPRLDASNAPAESVSPARRMSRRLVEVFPEVGIDEERGWRIGPSHWLF